jgi:hypothetical protein
MGSGEARPLLPDSKEQAIELRNDPDGIRTANEAWPEKTVFFMELLRNMPEVQISAGFIDIRLLNGRAVYQLVGRREHLVIGTLSYSEGPYKP